MTRRRTGPRALTLAIALIIGTASLGGTHPDDPSSGGTLPPTSRNTALVGKLELTTRQGGISDVAVLGNTAYVGAYAGECPTGGVHVVDITVPHAPVKIGFIPAGPSTYVGEGVQALSVETASFSGDILVHSNEPCVTGGRGGFSIWDVSVPLRPTPLAIEAGERTNGRTHPAHSVFAWQQGSKLYAVMVDESGDHLDVDIFDITNPRKPKMIKETGLAHWPKAHDAQARGIGLMPASFFHDVWVRKVGRKWLMLLSYWDAGWVVLNINKPSKPRYVRDSTYPRIDKTTRKRAEGNAHQAVWSHDGRFIIGTNEDLISKFTFIATERGFYRSAQLSWAVPLERRFKRNSVAGPTIFVGTACPGRHVIPRSQTRTSPGDVAIAIVIEGACSAGEKLRAIYNAGYDLAVIAASHERADFGRQPYRFDCISHNDGIAARVPALCITHADFHALFGQQPSYGSTEPRAGERGSFIRAMTIGDETWGDVRLLDGKSMREIDAYQIAGAKKYPEAAGTLSVHEVKLDPRKGVNLVYASWYAGGLRVLRFGKGGLKETGSYIDQGGNMFWGTYPFIRTGLNPMVALSDMNYGLYIVEYTGAR